MWREINLAKILNNSKTSIDFKVQYTAVQVTGFQASSFWWNLIQDLKSEHKISHDWVGKVIHLELCKNETQILWDFAVQTDLQIPTRRPGLVLTNQRKPVT